MGLDIIIPVVLIAIVVPVALAWAKKNLKDAARDSGADDPVSAPSARLTSNALRELPVPPWRIVYEISEERLEGVEHVLIGPAGVFALRTSMDPLPEPPSGEPDAHAVARAAIARGGVDDALRGCAMTSDRLVWVHWGAPQDGRDVVETVPGTIAVDGRSLTAWASSLTDERLSPAQVDLAWQTVTTAIGRPDPLA